MNAVTGIIILALILLIIFSIKSYMKKLASGCCGAGERVTKVKASDTDVRHYTCHKTVEIEGMVCQNCARRIENAFNAQEGMMAKVNLEKRQADIYGKSSLSEDMIRRTVTEAGYIALRIESAV